MRHAAQASRFSFAAHPETVTPSIWISDAQLADSFHRFARCFKRHGSHVPGPLEARRRAAKRRNTDLASIEARLPIDSTFLLPSQPQTLAGWWQSNVSPTPDTPPKSFLGLPIPAFAPSWSIKPPSPPRQAQVRPAAILDKNKRESAPTRIGSVLMFTSRLKTVTNLYELRMMFASLKVPLAQKRKCSEFALAHVLRAQWDADALRDFMFDMNLNIPGCDDYNILIRQWTNEQHSNERKLQLVDIVCQSISLGLVATSDIRLAVQQVWTASVVNEKPDEAPGIYKFHLRIINAIQASSVMTLEDLGRPFLERWFSKLLTIEFHPTVVGVLSKLQPFGAKSELDLSTDLLCQWFAFWLEDVERRSTVMPLSSFMHRLPTISLTPALLQATERTVQLVKTKHYDRQVLTQWHTLLSNLEASMVHILFPRTNGPWRQLLRGSNTDITDLQRLLLVCWIATSICTLKVQRARLLKSTELHLDFQRLFPASTSNDHPDILAQVFTTLQTLPLPHQSLLLQNLRHLTHDYLVVQSPSKKLHACLRRIPGRGFHLLQNSTDYESMKGDFSGTLIQIAESVNSDLPRFFHIAQKLIATDKLAFRVIIRILRHNHALHHTLSQSHVARVNITRPSKIKINRVTGQSATSLTPRQLLHQIHLLALSFATTPVVSPRLAFQKVYWCYLLLHRYGAPIEPPMTRALWHAGVARYLGSEGSRNGGVTTTRLRWLLDLIRQVEGPDVASKLVGSVQFRREAEMSLHEAQKNGRGVVQASGQRDTDDAWMDDMDDDIHDADETVGDIAVPPSKQT